MTPTEALTVVEQLQTATVNESVNQQISSLLENFRSELVNLMQHQLDNVSEDFEDILRLAAELANIHIADVAADQTLTIERARQITGNSFVDSVLRQYDQRGTLSEKQWAALIKATEPPDPKLGELVDSLRGSTNDFISNLIRQYDDRGSLSPKQVACLERAKQEANKPVEKIDFTELRELTASMSKPTVRVGDPGSESTAKLRIDFPPKYNGRGFVNTAQEYGTRRRIGTITTDDTYSGDMVETIRRIAADPIAAMRKYAELTHNCGMCGRVLENDESKKRGFGPECAKKLGMI